MLSGCFFKAIKPKTIPKTAKATPKKQPAPVKILMMETIPKTIGRYCNDNPYTDALDGMIYI